MNYVSVATDIGSNALSSGLDIGKTIAKAIPTDRKCSVTVTNKSSCYTLCNPRVHTESGKCVEPFAPTIDTSSPGTALFSKTANTARGAVGVFTYDLYNNSTKTLAGRMAVMYKVPFDLNRKDNAYAVGIVDLSSECNKELFQQMSKTTDPTFTREKAKGPSITHRSDSVTVRATMSDCHTPAMKIEVSDN